MSAPLSDADALRPLTEWEVARLSDDLSRVVQPETILLRCVASIRTARAELAACRAALEDVLYTDECPVCLRYEPRVAANHTAECPVGRALAPAPPPDYTAGNYARQVKNAPIPERLLGVAPAPAGTPDRIKAAVDEVERRAKPPGTDVREGWMRTPKDMQP